MIRSVERDRIRQQVQVPGFVVTAGVHLPNAVLPRHDHARPTLCCVLRGRFTEYMEGHALDCTSGTVKVTPAGDPHWDRFGPCETRGLMVEIDPDRFADHPAVMRALRTATKVDGGEFDALTHAIARRTALRDDATAVALEGALLELLAGIAREALPKVGPGRPRWVSDAHEIIHAESAQRLTLSSVAQRVQVHPVTLARAYRRHFGRSVGEDLRVARIARAERMLVETDEPLSRIAVETGFYDQSHFANTFRRLTGTTPAEYRRARRR